MSDRKPTRQLIEEYFQRGDTLGWFEALYRQAAGDSDAVPWARLQPTPDLIAWLDAYPLDPTGKRAVVVGCGLGDDAEALAARGFSVTAFDIAPSAIAWCQQRFPDSTVTYLQADLLALPEVLHGQFDVVFECRTLQALPWELNARAIAGVASLVAPGGAVLVVCLGRDPHEDRHGIPWAQSREELAEFTRLGLVEESFSDSSYESSTDRRHFCIVYRAPRG